MINRSRLFFLFLSFRLFKKKGRELIYSAWKKEMWPIKKRRHDWSCSLERVNISRGSYKDLWCNCEDKTGCDRRLQIPDLLLSLSLYIYIYIFSQKRYFWADGYYYGETGFIKFVNIQIYFSIIRKRNKSVNSIEANNEKSKSIVVTRSLFPDRTLLYRGILVDARLNEFPNWLNPLSIRKLVLFEREIVGKRGKINGITIIFVSYNRLENIVRRIKQNILWLFYRTGFILSLYLALCCIYVVKEAPPWSCWCNWGNSSGWNYPRKHCCPGGRS